MRAGYKRFNKPAAFDAGAVAAKAGTLKGLLKAGETPIALVPTSPDAVRYWPRFRGPSGQGETDGAPLPVEWSNQKNILWRSAISGSGNSSPIIWGDRIFLTSSAEEGKNRLLHIESVGKCGRPAQIDRINLSPPAR